MAEQQAPPDNQPEPTVVSARSLGLAYRVRDADDPARMAAATSRSRDAAAAAAAADRHRRHLRRRRFRRLYPRPRGPARRAAARSRARAAAQGPLPPRPLLPDHRPPNAPPLTRLESNPPPWNPEFRIPSITAYAQIRTKFRPRPCTRCGMCCLRLWWAHVTRPPLSHGAPRTAGSTDQDCPPPPQPSST